jgi:hypothetical protein
VKEMLLDKRFLFGVLNGTITVYFTKILRSEIQKKNRIVYLNEHNIRLLEKPNANWKYGVVELLSAHPSKIKDVTDEEIKKGGYKNREDFVIWCKEKYNLLSEDDKIGVVDIELHVIKEHGKQIFKDLGLVIPKVRW